jgi:glycopeptide antibiotics resistance protein
MIVMQKRLISALVLIVYSALLIKVVVFKSMMGLPGSGLMGRPGPPDSPPMVRFGPAREEAQHRLIRFTPSHANYMPFKTIFSQLRGEPRWSTAIINLVGNVALFVPLGFLVPFVYRKMTWQKSLVLAVAVGLTMEGMEGVFRVGIVDVDDVMLNALGVMIGYQVFTVCERRRRNTFASASVNEPQANQPL